MVSFKEYYTGQIQNKGNYLSIGVDNPEIYELTITPNLRPAEGVEVPAEKKHITLMYSPDSNLDPFLLGEMVKMSFTGSCHGIVSGYACFDDLPKDGERDEAKATIVAKIESETLRNIHEYLKGMGCNHTYPDFSPHISLWYGAPKREAEEIVEVLNFTRNSAKVYLSGIKSNVIIKNWADTLKEASYEGNVGAMEMVKFFSIATTEEKVKLKALVSAGKNKEAWEMIQSKLNIKLHKSILGNHK